MISAGHEAAELRVDFLMDLVPLVRDPLFTEMLGHQRVETDVQDLGNIILDEFRFQHQEVGEKRFEFVRHPSG